MHVFDPIYGLGMGFLYIVTLVGAFSLSAEGVVCIHVH
jgi:hypothetical protein